MFIEGEISHDGKSPVLQDGGNLQRGKRNSRFLTFAYTLDYEKFNLIKWPFAVLVWFATGLVVAIANTPTIGDTFVTIGQHYSILLVMFCGIGVGGSLAWLVFRINMASVRLHSEYLSRQRQLYRASEAARKKLLKSWGDQL